MPVETSAAIEWALTQEYTDFGGITHQITLDEAQPLVDKVCQYFATNNVVYPEFDYYDLEPFFNQ